MIKKEKDDELMRSRVGERGCEVKCKNDQSDERDNRGRKAGRKCESN
jgi:hypothetical protein